MKPLNSRKSAVRNFGSECPKLPKSRRAERKARKAASRRMNKSFSVLREA